MTDAVRQIGPVTVIALDDAEGPHFDQREDAFPAATARDWARFGQFLLQDGVWDGKRLLSEDYMTAVRSPSQASGGLYTGAQTWLAGPDDKPSSAYGLPDDTVWLQGHDGQTVAIIPSEKVVVVRMGLTPSKLGWVPQPLVKAVIDALR